MALTFAFIVFIGFLHSNWAYCTPKNSSCWPSEFEIQKLRSDLSSNSKLLTNSDPSYYTLTQTKNRLIKDRPYFVLAPSSSDTIYDDIKHCITFIRKHNLLLTIFSTGHSYSGRSSGEHIANCSFQINFRHMNGIYHTDNSISSLTIEPGAIWIDIYKYIANISSNTKVVVGGGGSTVGPVGYLLGGGHSPISAYFGLGVDSVLSFDIILANQSRAIVSQNSIFYKDLGIWNNASNNSLFWSLRGSGGSTFGIILNVTIATHSIDDFSFIGFDLEYPWYTNNHTAIGLQVLNYYISECLPTFSKSVNAYTLIITDPAIPLVDLKKSAKIRFHLLYLGNLKSAKSELECIEIYHSDWQINGGAEYIEYNQSYFEWIEGESTGNYLNQLFFSSMYSMDNLTQNDGQFVDTIASFVDDIFLNEDNYEIFHKMGGSFSFCMNHLGFESANFGNVNDMALSASFRKARIYMWTSAVFMSDDEIVYNAASDFMNDKALTFYNISLGTYLNENSVNNTNWTENLWGHDHYQELQKNKGIYDPEPSLFDCYHCVKKE